VGFKKILLLIQRRVFVWLADQPVEKEQSYRKTYF
jgi:hypothetical protein